MGQANAAVQRPDRLTERQAQRVARDLASALFCYWFRGRRAVDVSAVALDLCLLAEHFVDMVNREDSG
jgi:hypothetical protein